MCTIINLLKQCFLLLIILCTYLERCSNFELEANYIFYVTVFQCKWVSGVDTYEAEIAADSIIWELFAKKSAECLNLRNSFITISSSSGITLKPHCNKTNKSTLLRHKKLQNLNLNMYVILSQFFVFIKEIQCNSFDLKDSFTYQYHSF